MTNDGADKEAAIAALISQGSGEAAEAVYRAYAGYLTGVCTRYLSDPEEVKDVLHDSFIKIFSALPTFEYRGKGSLKAWLTRIMVNGSLKYLQRDALFVPYEEVREEKEEPADEPPIEGIPPEAIHAMIRELPPGYRTVLNLYVFEQKSHREIAALLNIKETTSASQYHRAKGMLARSIREYLKKHNQ